MPTPRTKSELFSLIRDKTNWLMEARTQAVEAVMNKNKSLAETLKEKVVAPGCEIMKLKLELRELEKGRTN